jgi:hypothetical protein
MPIHVPPISRRDFLAGAIATGAGLFLPQPLWASEKPVDPNRFVLQADSHVSEDRAREYRGVKPAHNFALVSRRVLADKPLPGGWIIAGDCACNEGKSGDYAVLAEVTEPARKAGIPMHFALGNHDHRENFWRAFPEAKPTGGLPVPDKHVSIVDTPHVRWFLLDSLDKTNVTPGLLGKAQLDWFANALDAHADKPALVVAHHDPNSGGRTSGLRDTEALFAILAPRRHAQAFFFGHTHAWHVANYKGIHLVNLPATAWLFDAKQPRAWVEAKLEPDKATLTLHALDEKHPAHRQTVNLKWRT